MAIKVGGTKVIDTQGFFNTIVLSKELPTGDPAAGTMVRDGIGLYVYDGSTWIRLNYDDYLDVFGGGTIVKDGLKRDFVFTSSGTVTVFVGTDVEYQILAGGGAGGGFLGGGGGGGGFRTGTMTLTPSQTPISVTVGSGGAYRGSGQDGLDGGWSAFNGITSAGGGGGAGYGRDGVAGGCGGGGGCGENRLQPGGAGNTPSVSPSQGNPGGSGHSYVPYYPGAGGGGGIGSPGSNRGGSWNSPAGPGGNGSPVYGEVRGGGGGGGQYYDPGQPGASAGNGGTGGGGDGGGGVARRPATAGLANYGGGGGGTGETPADGYTYYPGKPGGSGLVVLSYTY